MASSSVCQIGKSYFSIHPVSDSRWEEEDDFGYLILEKEEGWNRKEINKIISKLTFKTSIEWITLGKYWQINIYL